MTGSMAEFKEEDPQKDLNNVSLTSEEQSEFATKQEKVDKLASEYGVNEKKLTWKLDLSVLPPFCLLYFLSFLDRVNISNAKLYGLSEDLNLTGNQYNTALTLFFVPYVFFEVLSNYLIKFIKPHMYLSICIFIFGGVSVGMGFVTNFGGLAACRFLIGITEASTFPGLFYLLSSYYVTQEAQRRFSAFFSVTSLAGGASGAIAYRMNDLKGLHGLATWQWIFIVDGIVTAGCAIILYFTLADFPEEARFLKDNERKFLKEKLEVHSGIPSGFETKNTISDISRTFVDYLVWIPSLIYFGLIIPSYGYAYFSATIVKEMGYTAVSANQHSVYPWICAFGFSNIVSFASDKAGKRLPFVIATCCTAIIGLALILGATHNPSARYAGCFLAASGLYTAMPLVVCWSTLNYGGHLRKSMGTAWQIGFGNIGGIISTFLFLQKDAPVYAPGLGTSIAFTVFSICLLLVYFVALFYVNRKKQKPDYKEKYASLAERARILAGDKNPEFTYTY